MAKQFEERKLREAAKCSREEIGEAMNYSLDDYPAEHRKHIRISNMIERLNGEIRRCTHG